LIALPIVDVASVDVTSVDVAGRVRRSCVSGTQPLAAREGNGRARHDAISKRILIENEEAFSLRQSIPTENTELKSRS
jgi:hypothetical protein